MVAKTRDTLARLREDVVERAMLLAWSKTDVTCVHNLRDSHAVRYS
jgi:hypothetical protein